MLPAHLEVPRGCSALYPVHVLPLYEILPCLVPRWKLQFVLD